MEKYKHRRDIEELIESGESQDLEFKESLRLKDGIGETVSGFSNSDGGVVLVGISDGGEPIGVEIGGNTIEELANYIKRNTDPRIFPSVKILDVGGMNVVMIEVRASAEKPVFFKNHGYKRVGKTNQRISSSELRKLAKESGEKIYWDEQIYKEASLEDIEKEKVRWFVKEAKEQRGLDISEDLPLEEVLMRLKLTRNKKLTNAAILLFGKNPQIFFTRPEVKCIRFKGTDVAGKMLDFKVIQTNLFDQLTESEKFIINSTFLLA